MNSNNHIKEVLWQLIEKHYNVNRKDPIILTAKNPMMGNSIDKIGDELATSIEVMIEQVIQQMQSPPTPPKVEEPKNDSEDLEIEIDTEISSKEAERLEDQEMIIGFDYMIFDEEEEI